MTKYGTYQSIPPNSPSRQPLTQFEESDLYRKSVIHLKLRGEYFAICFGIPHEEVIAHDGQQV